MDFKNLQSELGEDQDQTQDANSGMKIKLLDDLIEKIMSMDDVKSDESKDLGMSESLESPTDEAKEKPDLQIKEISLGKEKPMDGLEDKLKGMKY